MSEKGILDYKLGEKEFLGKDFVEMVLKDCGNKPLELKKLVAKDCSGIKSIQGIEIFKNLNYLDLEENQITSIVGIEKLINLTNLYLNNNQITSIVGIEKLINLTNLYLFNNQITSIVGIEKLINLTDLSLRNNQITSIIGIEKLINLTELYLSDNQITSIVGIEKLINLTKFDIYNNQITSIVGIEKLINLTVLYLDNNQITSIVGIEKLINLTNLYLYNNQITSIVGLEKLINLTELYLFNNQITSIVGIEKLINLTELYLHNNQITSIVGIEKLINLTELGLSNNQITSIVGIEKLKNLKELRIKNLKLSLSSSNYYVFSLLIKRKVKLFLDSKLEELFQKSKIGVLKLYLNEFEDEEINNLNLSKYFRQNSFLLKRNQKISIDKPFYFDAEFSKTFYEEPKKIVFNYNEPREIIVIDYKNDKELKEFFREYIIEKKLKEKYSLFYNNWRKEIDKFNNISKMKEIVQNLMKRVSNTFGGQDVNKIRTRYNFYIECEKHILAYLREKKTCLLPLGDMFYQFGVCRHRSLLFKMAADYIGIPCRLWGGKAGGSGHMWNVVDIGGISYGADVNEGLDLVENLVNYETFHKGIKSGGIGPFWFGRDKYDLKWIKENYKTKGEIEFERRAPSFCKGIYEVYDEKKSKDYVVVKEIEVKGDNIKIKRRVKRELYYLKFFNNDHIIKLLDYKCDLNKTIEVRKGRRKKTVNQSTWAFLFELYDGNGAKFIDEWLKSLNGDKVIQIREALIFLLEIMKGIRYLHSLGIAHLDLKPENILLNWNRKAKRIKGKVVLCDFETSKESWKNKFSATMGSHRYGNAPEIIDPDQTIGLSVDVWGFGLLVVDIFNVINPKNQSTTSINPNLKKIIKNVRALSKKCQQNKPSSRPSPQQIIETLAKEMKDLSKYEKTYTCETYLKLIEEEKELEGENEEDEE